MLESVYDCSYNLRSTCPSGGRGHLDVQPHLVTALAWPRHKGVVEGCMGLSTDALLVGRLDGSLAVIEALDYATFRRKELSHCSRQNGAFYPSLCFLSHTLKNSDDMSKKGNESHVMIGYVFSYVVSVSHLEWYEEDGRFAVAFADGAIHLCGREDYMANIAVEAHEVGTRHVDLWERR